VSAFGQGIAGSSDQLDMAYLPLVGEGTIVARVVSLQSDTGSAQAGVMIREGDQGGSRGKHTLSGVISKLLSLVAPGRFLAFYSKWIKRLQLSVPPLRLCFSYSRLLPPRPIAKSLTENKTTGAGDGNPVSTRRGPFFGLQ
jgi:hypothetical protein